MLKPQLFFCFFFFFPNAFVFFQLFLLDIVFPTFAHLREEIVHQEVPLFPDQCKAEGSQRNHSQSWDPREQALGRYELLMAQMICGFSASPGRWCGSRS